MTPLAVLDHYPRPCSLPVEPVLPCHENEDHARGELEGDAEGDRGRDKAVIEDAARGAAQNQKRPYPLVKSP